MRKSFPFNLIHTRLNALLSVASVKITTKSLPLTQLRQPLRCLADVRDHRVVPDVWFTGTFPRSVPDLPGDSPGDTQRPDERTVKLGKSEWRVRWYYI